MDNILKDIIKTINHARMCHEAWWFFTGTNENRDDILKVYNHYLTLFETIRPALFTTFVIKLASVFDKDENSINLNIVVKEIEKSSGKKFGTTQIDFDNLWKKGRRLFKYRNKVIAHRDKGVRSRNFAKETGFSYDDLRIILEEVTIFLDEALLFIGKGKLHKFSNTFDLEKIINDLLKIIKLPVPAD
jgi:hypothetical protein